MVEKSGFSTVKSRLAKIVSAGKIGFRQNIFSRNLTFLYFLFSLMQHQHQTRKRAVVSIPLQIGDLTVAPPGEYV